MVIKAPTEEQWLIAMAQVSVATSGERVVELEAVRAWAHSVCLECDRAEDPDGPLALPYPVTAIRFNYSDDDAKNEYGGFYYVMEDSDCRWETPGSGTHGDNDPFRLMVWELMHVAAFGDWREKMPIRTRVTTVSPEVKLEKIKTDLARARRQDRRFTTITYAAAGTTAAAGILGHLFLGSMWYSAVVMVVYVAFVLGVLTGDWLND